MAPPDESRLPVAPPRPDESDERRSILRELILNQYQAIVLGGASLASLVTMNPVPLLVWLGTELVMMPLLDSPPVRRLVNRRRREKARLEAETKRNRLVAGLGAEYARRFASMEKLCAMIEANYKGLHGISQAYLSEQRGKLDVILDSCLNRMLALGRYEKTLVQRSPRRVEEEIEELTHELESADLNERARKALEKNLELKRKLLAAYADARGNMKALATELDSMLALLEVLHQNSISMRDPQAVSEELDSIVRQSEDSQKVVREMEALLRAGVPDWTEDAALTEPAPETGPRDRAPGAQRRRERNR